MSLNPGTRIANPYPETPAERGLVRQTSPPRLWVNLAVGAVTGSNLDIVEEVELLQNQAVGSVMPTDLVRRVS